MPTVDRISARSGPFWDAVEGRAPLPPAAATLGLEVVDVRPEFGTIEVAFAAGEAFTTPFGDVLGGFLAAMLYDTVGPAVLATLDPTRFIQTLDLATHFVQPCRPGRLTGHGRIVHQDGDRYVVSADLADEHGAVVASATATVLAVSPDVTAAATGG